MVKNVIAISLFQAQENNCLKQRVLNCFKRYREVNSFFCLRNQVNYKYI